LNFPSLIPRREATRNLFFVTHRFREEADFSLRSK